MTMKQSVYLDSPVMLALNQIAPYFDSGIFSKNETIIFIRRKLLTTLQLPLVRAHRGLNVRQVKGGKVASLPVEKGSVQFYPFNSQSNLNAVTNRDIYHVLTLHGESNKIASYRPAARLYDYITIAGPAARDRYLKANIFTHNDVDKGRLIMMGDSFVQDLPWFRATALSSSNGVVLYCPTWEGYGHKAENYSSINGKVGFKAAEKAANILKIKTILIKPHPYLGLLKQSILKDFIEGVKYLQSKGFHVELLSRDMNFLLGAMCKVFLSGINIMRESLSTCVDVKMAISDLSGMEAIFLKQGIKYMTIANWNSIPDSLESNYRDKLLLIGSDWESDIKGYIETSIETDNFLHHTIFGWQENGLRNMSCSDRNQWLIRYVQNNSFWSNN